MPRIKGFDINLGMKESFIRRQCFTGGLKLNKRSKGLLSTNATLKKKSVGAKANEFERTGLFGGNYKARRKEIAGGKAT